MARAGALLPCLAAAFWALVAGAAAEQGETRAAPRVMSLNVCTDQLVLALADPAQIVSLSALADDPNLSFGHEAARAYPKNHGLAEEVLAAKPDLVVTGTYSLHNTTELLQRLGIPVHAFAYTQTLPSIPADIRRMGRLLRQEQRSEAQARTFERNLKRLRTNPPGLRARALAYGQNGVVLGGGTLADSVLQAAGFTNVAGERGHAGMTPYPLELLLFDHPDLVLLSAPYAEAPALADQIPAHPAIRELSATIVENAFRQAAWTCGGSFTLEALKALKKLRKRL